MARREGERAGHIECALARINNHDTSPRFVLCFEAGAGLEPTPQGDETLRVCPFLLYPAVILSVGPVPDDVF